VKKEGQQQSSTSVDTELLPMGESLGDLYVIIL
jgi:hypothetical protein